MSGLEKTVDFSIIRYANCWEDADILLTGLAIRAGVQVLCVASAGDIALSLLTTNPAGVHGIDMSEVQLYLTELKQVAFDRLAYPELLQLLGVTGTDTELRLQLYRKLSPFLTPGTRNYWNENRHIVEAGIIYNGKFERYFYKFRRYMLPLVHSRQTIKQLIAPKAPGEQAVFYNHTWNTFRFRLLMRVFFGKYVLGRLGRDPKFLEHIHIPVGKYIQQKAERHLQSDRCQENYFLHMIFTGSFGNHLPHYLRPENYETIRNNIHKLSLENISAEQAISKRTYGAYCLSNIFEYISAEEFMGLAAEWAGRIPTGARLAYWNLMAARSFSESCPGQYTADAISKDLTNIDKGFFYSRFIIEQKL